MINREAREQFAAALAYGKAGLFVFPILEGTKDTPLIKQWGIRASCDAAQLTAWWTRWPNANIGLACMKSGIGVVDSDVPNGEATLQAIADNMEGELSPTKSSRTPRGGRHRFYKGRLATTAGKIGPNVDTRGIGSGNGGYVLLPPSRTAVGAYKWEDQRPMAEIDPWVVAACGESVDNGPASQEPLVEWDLPRNIARAREYLTKDAPVSKQGAGGDELIVKRVVPTLKDMAISEELAGELMAELWNPRCEPPWQLGDCDPKDDLYVKVHNGYLYCRDNPPGIADVEVAFGADTKERDDQVRKVKALLDKTEEAGCTPEEAKTSADTARRLMTLYGLQDDDLKDEPEVIVETYKDLCEKWVYVVAQELFVARERDTLGEIYSLSVPAFTKAYKFIAKREKLGGRYRNIVDHILNQTPGLPGAMTRYSTFSYMPGKPEDFNGALNLWRPSDIVVPDKKPDTSTKWFHDHLELLFSDEADRVHALNWMAAVYQNQELHPHHALLIHGRETGTGKSVIKNTMTRLLGTANCTEIDQKLLDNDFEKWKVCTKLLSVEEVRPAWGTSNAVLKNLHTLISEDRMPVNIKKKDDFQMTNVIAVIGGSNKDDALAIDDTERRWLILSTDRNGTLRPLANEYYRAIYGRKGVGGLLNDRAALEALAYELKYRDLGDYDIGGPAPRTEAKSKMAETAAHAIERWMVENADNMPLCHHVVTVEDIMTAMPPDVARTEKDPRQRVADVLVRKFKATRYRVRLALSGKGDRAKTVVWVLNRTDPKGKTLSGEHLAWMYKSERYQVTAADKAAHAAYIKKHAAEFAD